MENSNMVHLLRNKYRQLIEEAAITFQSLLDSGKAYSFEGIKDFDEIDDFEYIVSNAEKISYTHYNGNENIVYLLSIDRGGIEILTEERDIELIQYNDLYDLSSQLTVIEKLSE